MLVKQLVFWVTYSYLAANHSLRQLDKQLENLFANQLLT
jgi:hypothetical protein